MKTLITIILASVCSLSLYAQHTANLDFFVGTWRYENPQTGEEFILKLRKTSHLLTPSDAFATEYVVGAYTYKKSGQTIIDCMDKFDQNLHIHTMPIRATNSVINQSWVNPNRLRMSVFDYGKFAPNGDAKRTGSNELLIVSSITPNQIRWILKNDRGPVLEEEAAPLEFSIPTDIILTRVLPPSEIILFTNPPTGGAVTGAGTFPAGSRVTISATPSHGYNFVNWTGSATVNTASHTFTVNDNMNFTANFAPISPCELVARIVNSPIFREIMPQLHGVTYHNREYIVKFWNDHISVLPGPIGEHSADIPMPNDPIRGIAHSHFGPQAYSIFTPSDIFRMQQLYANGKIDPRTFFMVLVTPHGPAYMLTIDIPNYETHYDFPSFPWRGSFTIDSGWQRELILLYFYLALGIVPGVYTNQTESAFLHFLEWTNAGLNLFRSYCPNFSNWERLQRLPNGQVVATPCL